MMKDNISMRVIHSVLIREKPPSKRPRIQSSSKLQTNCPKTTRPTFTRRLASDLYENSPLTQGFKGWGVGSFQYPIYFMMNRQIEFD